MWQWMLCLGKIYLAMILMQALQADPPPTAVALALVSLLLQDIT